jgi:cyclopropane fatty-acyl-phospholipid synthase-like methyltransferase
MPSWSPTAPRLNNHETRQMTFEKPEDFYAVYDQHRTYVRADVRKKHVAEFTRNIWTPAGFQTSHRVVEFGCGVGLFLAYLAKMGVTDFMGVEMDPKTRDFMPAHVAERVLTTDIATFLDGHDGKPFDRIVLLDVFEHFSYVEGVKLLEDLKPLLAPDGKLVLRTPNCASPWGLQFQYNDLTHKANYAPGNIGHVALAAGMKAEACLSYTRGSWSRRLTTKLVEGTLNRLLTDPPPVWTANFVTIISSA